MELSLDRDDVSRIDNPQLAKGGAHRVGDVGWRQVAVVVLDHARIPVPQLRCHHWQRCAPHNQPAGVGVPQDME